MSDIGEVTQLVLHERQGRDRGWWKQQAATFHEDSLVRLSWFQGPGAEFVARSEQMSASGDPARHRLGPPVVSLAGDRGFVELPAIIEFHVVLDGAAAELASYARAAYRVERREGRWGIVGLDAIYERDTLTPSFPGVRLDISQEEVNKFPRAPYRFLAYHLSRRGYSIADDLLGDDRPEELAAFYKEAADWAGLTLS